MKKEYNVSWYGEPIHPSLPKRFYNDGGTNMNGESDNLMPTKKGAASLVRWLKSKGAKQIRVEEIVY
tara:strand:+ start:458 stop:658 length:201 start_codon:yes stop_codon:yes gene_type:complete